jgi:antitoxin component HigA of HigAB toxin-antitoxin module
MTDYFLTMTEEEYAAILTRISVLMDAKPDTPEMGELMALTMLAEEYEDEHYPIDKFGSRLG